MPIAVTPTTSYGNKTVSGTTSANALVLLKNSSSGEVVATTTADGSGDYSFTVSNSIPLQVSVPSSVDPQIQTTVDLTSPATPYSYYDDGDNNTAFYACVGIADFPQTNGSGPSYWIGTPKVEFVDAGPYLLNDAVLTYGFTGPGTGAKVEIEMTSVGEYYKSYSSRVQLTELYAGVAKPPKRFNVTNFGKNYQNPATKISGTNVQYYSGSIEQLESSLGITTGFTYNNSTYYTRQWEYYLQVYGRQLELGESQLYNVWGSDKSQWGVYNSDYSDGKFSVALPGEQDVTEPADDSSVDGATALQDVKDVIDNANYYNGSQLAAYFAIIYGQNPNDITHTGNPAAPFSGVPSNVLDGGALWAYNQNPKIISKQELDLLKGYFGRKLMVEPISNYLPTTAFWNSYTAATALLGAWNIGQGVFQTSISNEIKSFSRQYNGLIITDMSQRIKPILDKITASGGKDFNTLQTQTNSGQRVLWNFNGTEPINSNL